ncbi:MAG: Rrf2 family transcriptional regulator [Lachnospiraceae bacterium]|nr:Rrf2 family transcriptional regulator [Lachnospiraceae bacterium]
MNSDFDVAVHAMVYLHHKGETLNSEELSENVCTNPGRIRRVLAQLKKAGLVETREGRFSGGYTYEKIHRVTLGDICRALNTRFADVAWRSGNPHMDCKVSAGMADYMDGLYQELNRQCTSYLDGITISDVEQALFSEQRKEKI